MSNKYFTIGEIFRLGLLKNADGKPYAHKATVSTVIAKSGLAFEMKTRWGMAKALSMKEIKRINKRTAQ